MSPRFEFHDSSDEHVNVMVLIKKEEEEHYCFMYRDQDRAEVLRLLGRFAGNDDLSFTWYDAAVLSQKVRNLSGGE